MFVDPGAGQHGVIADSRDGRCLVVHPDFASDKARPERSFPGDVINNGNMKPLNRILRDSVHNDYDGLLFLRRNTEAK